jgi:DNA polymerase
MGFFKESMLATGTAPLPMVARCGSCGLWEQCLNAKMPVWGRGELGVMIVGEAPGRSEDEQNRPFVGRAGQYLRGVLKKIGIDADRDCWITNSLICRPPANKTPTDKQIGYCRPNVLKAIADLKPHTIILLGASPVKSVIGSIWKEEVGPIGRWVGYRIPCQKPNAWLCPTFHPSHIDRAVNKTPKPEPTAPVLERMFEDHLTQAFKLRDIPWVTFPEYEKQVQVILEPEQAAKKINQMVVRGNPIVIDYETTTLKPDDKRYAEIYTCAVSDGLVTLSYPWQREAKNATIELLKNRRVKKITSNEKFEIRYTLATLGIEPGWSDWWHDDLLSAHTIDNRQRTAGLDFQAFIHLGVSKQNRRFLIEQYLKSDGNNTPNRIKELDLHRLLLYGGCDALYEWHVCVKQRKLAGLPWN